MTKSGERWWLWGCRPDESNLDLMLVEIVRGVPKERARSIRVDTREADAARWDRWELDIKASMARGEIITCDNGADDTD